MELLFSLAEFKEEENTKTANGIAFYLCRGSARENALKLIIEAFNNSLQHEFAEKKYALPLFVVFYSKRVWFGFL